MSKQVDQRIVQMQFDNKKFEQGVEQTIKSVSKLDATLNALNNISIAGLDKLGSLASKVDLSALGIAADAVASRMSAMGIVGATVLQNLTTAAMNTAKHLGQVTLGKVMSGGKNRALNIEAAKFQLEGLNVAWDKIEGDINYGVKDTAYGLDAAAKAASQLVASQVKLGDEMKASLRGISGVAAMTNSSYEDIANIFTTVAGNGKLMSMQLMQLSGRGLNAAATLGKQLHKSEAEIREMVGKGKIDFKTFSKAMDDAFGAHAKDANKTFTGALSNMGAALSRIGAEFYTPGLQYARDIFNSITGAVNQLKASLSEYHIFSEASKLMEQLSKTAVGFFENLAGGNKMNNAVGPMLNVIGKGLQFINKLLENGLHTKTLDLLAIAVKKVGGVFKAIGKGITDIIPLPTMGNIIYILQVIEDALGSFDKYSSNFRNIRDIIKGIASILIPIKDSIRAIYVLTKPIFDKATNKLKEIFNWLAEIGRKMYDYNTNSDVFSKIYDSISKLRPEFDKLKEKIDTSIELINQRFKSNFGKDIPELIQTLKDKIASIFAPKESGEVKKGIDWFGVLGMIIDGLTKAFLLLIDVIGVFYKVFSGGASVFELISGGFSKLGEYINTFVAFMNGKDVKASFGEGISEGLADFLTDARDIFNNFKQIAKDAYVAVKPLIDNLVEMLKTVSFKDIAGAGLAGAGITGLAKLINKLSLEKVQIKALLEFFGITKGKGGTSTTSIRQSFANVLYSASHALDTFTASLKVNTLKEAAITIAILAGSLFVLASLDDKKLATGLAGVSALLAETFGALKVLDTMSAGGGNGGKLLALSAVMVMLSVSMALFASSLKKVAKIDPDRLSGAILAFTVIFGELLFMINTLFEKKVMFTGDLIKIAESMVLLGVALRIMASALAVLGKLDGGQLLKGVLGMTIVLGELFAFVFGAEKLIKGEALLKIAGSLVVLAVALNMLMIPITLLSMIPGKALAKSVVALAFVLGELALFSALMGNEAKQFAGVAASLILFAVALDLITIPMLAMATMGDRLPKVIIGMALLLTMIGSFAAIMTMVEGGAGLAVVGASLIVLAVALTMMMAPLAVMASLGDKLNKAISGLAILLLLLGSFATIMTMVEGGAGLAVVGASLIIFAVALNMLMIPLAALANMKPDGIKQMILAFSAIIIILGVMAGFMAFLGEFAAGIIAVGAGFLLLGASVALVGVGLAGIGAAVYLIVIAFNALVTTLAIVGKGLIELAVNLAFAIVAFLETLGNAGPQLALAGFQIITNLALGLIMGAGTVAVAVVTVLEKILEVLDQKSVPIIEHLVKFAFGLIDGLLLGLTEAVPKIARDLYNLCMMILDELVKLLKQTPMDLVDIFFGNGFDPNKNNGKKFKEFFKGLFDKNKDDEEVKEAGAKTADSLVESTADRLNSKESQDKITDSSDALLNGFVGSVGENSAVPDAFGDLMDNTLMSGDSVIDVKNGMSMETFARGEYMDKGLAEGLFANNFAEDAMDEKSKGLLDIYDENTGTASPSKEAIKRGGFLDEGLAIGINNSHSAEDAMQSKSNGLLSLIDSLGNGANDIDLSPLANAISMINEALNSDLDFQPTIVPVLDLSNVQSGFSSLSDLMSNQRSVALAEEASSLDAFRKQVNFQIQNDNNTQAINSLGARIDRLGDAIMNTQMIMDTGTVVGVMANPMDRELGRRAIQVKRGGARR